MKRFPIRTLRAPLAGALALIASTALSTGIASACLPQSTPIIEGIDWHYLSPDGGRLKLENGKVSGSDSCNLVFGDYTITRSPAGNVLTFGPIATTSRYCYQGHATQQAFTALFSRPNGYKVVTLPGGEQHLSLYPAGTKGVLSTNTMVFSNRNTHPEKQ